MLEKTSRHHSESKGQSKDFFLFRLLYEKDKKPDILYVEDARAITVYSLENSKRIITSHTHYTQKEKEMYVL